MVSILLQLDGYVLFINCSLFSFAKLFHLVRSNDAPVYVFVCSVMSVVLPHFYLTHLFWCITGVELQASNNKVQHKKVVKWRCKGLFLEHKHLHIFFCKNRRLSFYNVFYFLLYKGRQIDTFKL